MFKKVSPLFLALLLFVSGPSYAAPIETLAQASVLTNEEKTELTGTRRQLATIIFSGLSGAILGLSTLSFYGRPQDHLSNLAVGFALGVMTGAVFTTYKAATKPYEAYEIGMQPEPKLFEDESFRRLIAQENCAYQPRVGWSWDF